MFLHREILKQSWKIAWRNKYLWFFGFFAVFFGGYSGLEIIGRGLGFQSNSVYPADFKLLSETGIFKKESIANFFKLASEEPFSIALIVFIFVIILALFLFLVWISNVSQAAIINNTAQIKEKKEVNFEAGVSAGISKFWPVFALNIFKKAVIIILFMIMSLPLVLSESSANMFFGNISFSILFVLLVPVIVTMAFVVNFAISFAVIKQKSFNESIKRALSLFKNNWLISIEMGFLIYLVSLALTFIVIMTLLIFTTPFLLLFYIAVNIQSLALFIFFLVLAFIVFTLIVTISGAFLSSFQNIASALFFMKLISSGGKSKLVRVFDKNHR